jgi:hypothetical protein
MFDMLVSFFQKHDGVSAFVSGIGVWKVLANVAQACSSEQRIGNGMQQHICVGVT